MRKQNLLIVIAVFILASSFVPMNSFQTDSRFIKSTKHLNEPNWVGLLETDTELEVLYSLANCDDQKKLLLKYFNEMPMGQEIKYKINLKYTGYFLDEEKWKSVSPNQVIAADCGAADTSMYVLLPPNWDLERVTVTASLIEVKQQ